MKLSNPYQIGWLLPPKSHIKMYLNLDVKNWKIYGAGIILERKDMKLILIIKNDYIDFQLEQDWNEETVNYLYEIDKVSERQDF